MLLVFKYKFVKKVMQTLTFILTSDSPVASGDTGTFMATGSRRLRRRAEPCNCQEIKLFLHDRLHTVLSKPTARDLAARRVRQQLSTTD